MHHHSPLIVHPLLNPIVSITFYDSSVAYFRTSVAKHGVLIANLLSYVAYLRSEIGSPVKCSYFQEKSTYREKRSDYEGLLYL